MFSFSAARMSHILALGLKSLMLHRLRSILTTMGMVFGVASVIAMLAIGEGANFEAQQQIQELGSQNIILRTIKPPEEQNKQQRQGSYILNYGLTYEDVLGIERPFRRSPWWWKIARSDGLPTAVDKVPMWKWWARFHGMGIFDRCI